jgi:large conductance mechanosensitive channel
MERENAMSALRDFGERGLHSGLRTMGDFEKFILRGNVVDLAVGIVIGAAFNNVVQEFVKDVITPFIGLFGGFNFPAWAITVNHSTFAIGAFLNAIISFLIIAAVVYFFVVRPVNALQDRFTPHKDEKPTTRQCPFCLSTVPRGATRCAYCTAQLPPEDAPAAATGARA